MPESRVAETEDRRTYRSPLRVQRAEQTRRALLDAAAALFASKGWVATGMRDVAREAGVATETVYSHFANKSGLLQAVIDLAVVGDDRAVPVSERPEFLALAQGARSRRVEAAGRLITAIHRRTAAFARVLREAAAADEAMAAALKATRERQRLDVERGAALIIGREPTASERDGFWALASPEVYLLLVEESGWDDERYERWITEMLQRTLPRS